MTQVEQRPNENSGAAQAEIERLTQALSREHDMHLRALADFDNYRKRMQREWDSASQAGKRQLVQNQSTDMARLRQLSSDLQQLAAGLAATGYAQETAGSAGRAGRNGPQRGGAADEVIDAEFKPRS